MSSYYPLGRLSEFPNGAMRTFSVGGRDVAVARVDDRFFAFADECSHRREYLTDGFLEGCRVACAYHEAIFDLATGAAVAGPTIEAIAVYALRVTRDALEIEWPEQLAAGAVGAVDHGDKNERLEREQII